MSYNSMYNSDKSSSIFFINVKYKNQYLSVTMTNYDILLNKRMDLRRKQFFKNSKNSVLRRFILSKNHINQICYQKLPPVLKIGVKKNV